jgi:hypothetical protein
MKRRVVLACMAVAALAAGCATQWDVEYYTAPDANVAAKRTFHWRGGELGAPAPLSPAAIAHLDVKVRDVVVAHLLEKGYVQASSAAEAELIVGYQVAGTRRFEVADDQRVGAPSPRTVLSPSEVQPPPASTLPREVLLRDGSLLIFIDDPATGKLIWRGMVAAELRIGSSEEGVRLIGDMAHQIAQQIPARAATP